MKLPREFIRLPLQFDAARLAAEAAQFGPDEWRPHPQGHAGNSAIPLVAAGGDPANEGTRGPMAPTPQLARCEYLRQVLAALGAPVGRARLMRIAGHGEATPHADVNYYWSQRVRVHIPVLTYPGVRFQCGEREVFMDHGQCWIFDTWRRHNVLNPDDRPRIHLVADTVGSDGFWQLVEAAGSSGAAAARSVPYQPGAACEPEYEQHNFPVVMSPWELDSLAASLCLDVAAESDEPPAALAAFTSALAALRQRWRALWARFETAPAGWPAYRAELERTRAALAPLSGQLQAPNGTDAVFAVQQWIFLAALNPDLAPPNAAPETSTLALHPRTSRPPQPHTPTQFDRPLFILSAPRSGSSLLFETLARAADLFTTGGESHQIIEAIPGLHPGARGWESNRLTAADATPEAVAQLYAGLAPCLRDRAGQPPAAGAAPRLLEKTPKNALRVPFLAAAFPEAHFIFLQRDPRETLASIIEAWQSGRFVTYPNLPGWQARSVSWSLLLIPGWPALDGGSLAELAAAQWQAANQQILDDLAALPAERQIVVRYAGLLADPQAEMERLCAWAGLVWDQTLEGALPLSRHTLTPPDPDKWRRHAAEIEPLLPGLQPLVERLNHFAARDLTPPGPPSLNKEGGENLFAASNQPVHTPSDPHTHALTHPHTSPIPPHAHTPTPDSPLRSQHTTSFPQLLSGLGLSLFVSTYQAGRLVVLRARGEVLNTHFRAFRKPMGLALQGGRLALGTELELLEFADMPAVARQLEPAGTHDAAFLPRGSFVTGDVQVHDIAWTEEGLCFVNTRFSCLCAPSLEYSFVPTWRPRFISALAPEDRCHLNGLAVRDGRPAYATALAESDTPAGWRDHKRDGGILMDIASSEIILRGLSMPHSPRWHAGRLWVLNSGEGGVGVVDLASGRYQEVARLPGFTRGLAFHGRYAFIGLSQIRESAVFSGIAIAELPLAQRTCGVWVLDVTTGQTVAFIQFQDLVQEIFAVEAAPGLRFPDVLTDDKERLAGSFVLPDEALQAVPPALRATAPVPTESGVQEHAAS